MKTPLVDFSRFAAKGFMIISIALWGVGFLFISTALCQGQDTTSSQRLINDFYRDTPPGSERTGNSQESLAVRTALPQEIWLMSKPAAIGISDAGLDSATAWHQAYLRALALLALSSETRVQMVAENFKAIREARNGVKSRFEEMYTVEASLVTKALPDVKTYFTLANGETIIVLDPISQSNCPPDSSMTDSVNGTTANGLLPDSLAPSEAVATDLNVPDRVSLFPSAILSIRCTLYHLEVATDRSQQVFRTEYTITSSDSTFIHDHDSFGYTSVNGRWCNFTSKWNGQELPVSSTRHYYFNGNPPPPPDSTLAGQLGMSTIEGLWPALITGVMWQVTGIGADSNATVRQVSDHYNNTRRDLSRVAESHRLNFKINRLAYESGKLFTLLEIEIIQNNTR